MTAVRVEGLRELDRAFGRASKELRRELRGELRQVGRIVADEARQVAARKGLRKTGRLIKSIRPSVKGAGVFVRAGAVTRSAKYPSGFNYPRRLEFEGGGRRAFLRPALASKQQQVVEQMERVLDRVADGFGRAA